MIPKHALERQNDIQIHYLLLICEHNKPERNGTYLHENVMCALIICYGNTTNWVSICHVHVDVFSCIFVIFPCGVLGQV